MEEKRISDIVFTTAEHRDLVLRGIPKELQGRGATEISGAEKTNLLTAQLRKDPGIFLERYGRLLTAAQLAYFRQAYPRNDEVAFHVKELGQRLSNAPADLKHRQQTVRNRRFVYLEKVLRKSDYFSVEKMRERAPYLYETSVTGSARVRPTRFAENLPLSERLMANIDSDRLAARFEAQKQEEAQFGEQEEEEENEDDGEDKEQLSDAESIPSKLGEADEQAADRPEDLRETQFMHTQFIKLMERRFLDGDDAEFVDYRAIDHDATLDDLDQLSRDEQEKYFDEM